MEKFCCVRLNLSGGFRGVVGVVSFSVDFNIRSDPVVIGLAGLESFAVGIACLRIRSSLHFPSEPLFLAGLL